MPEAPRWNLAGLSVLPICLAAALAPVNPTLVFAGGIWIGIIALLTSGRIPRTGPADYLALLLCCWASATLIWSRDVDSSRIAVHAWWTVALLLIAARHVLSSRRRLLLVAGCFLGGAGWVAVQLILARDEAAAGPALRTSLDGVGVNYTAYCLATAALVTVLLLAVRAGNRLVRVVLWLLLPLLTYATMLTGTRASLIALAAVAAYVIVSRFSERTWILAVPASASMLAVIPFGHLATYHPQWLENLFNRPLDDLSGRLAVWPIAEASFWESPLVGIGVGAFPSTNPYYEVGAHSLLLTLGNDLGLIGIVLFAALIGFLLRDAAPGQGRLHGLLVGALVVGWTPIWLSGHWEISPMAWLVLAVWSRLPVALPVRTAAHRLRRNAVDKRRPVGLRPRTTAASTGMPSAGRR
ncbi:O-antigen ligase family protein [Micromonospora sp. STR1_7]|uniref:O-antigen ligase family protein n=1 Tax=Micromonospora parastrephiae TaxID=2806101 RepID=A0ABS1XW36_9ACTN|nr:O-antigen ligase family protein [Micromonospora parastrephiae]MBM0233464.1 O-antigen ligase family protein [Micromonospora parastrephiae]